MADNKLTASEPMKIQIQAASEVDAENAEPLDDEFPKSVLITIDRAKTDPDHITVNRVVKNMGAFELYGLLTAVRDAVKAQMAFPESQLSDGITVSKKASSPK